MMRHIWLKSAVLLHSWMIIFSAADGFDGESISYWWEVNVLTLKSLEWEETFPSPAFSTWDDSNEEKWYLYLEKSLKKKAVYISLHLEALNDYSKDQVAEFFVYNKNPGIPSRKLRGSAGGKHNLVELDSLLDPKSGYNIDGKVKFGVKIRSTPALLQVRGQPSVTHSWEIGRLRLQNLRKGQWLSSPTFSTWNNSRKEKWALLITSEEEGSISFILVSLNKFQTSLKFVELFVRNKDPTRDIYRTVQPNILTFKELADGEGAKPFAHIEKLTDPDEGFIFDGYLQFGVHVSSDAAPLNDLAVIEPVTSSSIPGQPGNQPPKTSVPNLSGKTEKHHENRTAFEAIYKNVTVVSNGTTITIGAAVIKEGADSNLVINSLGALKGTSFRGLP